MAPGRIFFENWMNSPRPSVTAHEAKNSTNATPIATMPVSHPAVAPTSSRPKHMRDLTTTSSKVIVPRSTASAAGAFIIAS